MVEDVEEGNKAVVEEKGARASFRGAVELGGKVCPLVWGNLIHGLQPCRAVFIDGHTDERHTVAAFLIIRH